MAQQNALYSVLAEFVHDGENIVNDNNEFKFNPIFQITPAILTTAPIFEDGGNCSDQTTDEMLQYMNRDAFIGHANTGLGHVLNNKNNNLCFNLNEIPVGDSSQNLLMNVPDNERLELVDGLRDINFNGANRPVYVLYSDRFKGTPRNRSRTDHITAVIIYNNIMYSFGWGTDDPLPELWDTDQYNRVGAIISPENAFLSRTTNIFDVGYFTEAMRDNLEVFVNNSATVFATGFETNRYIEGRGRNRVTVVDTKVDAYKAILRDYKYWLLSAKYAKATVGRLNCASFIEHVFNSLQCDWRGVCRNLPRIQITPSNPPSCTRMGGRNNYLNEDGTTNIDALIDAIRAWRASGSQYMAGGRFKRRNTTRRKKMTVKGKHNKTKHNKSKRNKASRRKTRK